MRLFAKTVIIYLGCIFVSLISCCPKPETYNYEFESLSIENLDNSGEEPVVVYGDAGIPKMAYGIRLILDHKQIAFHSLNYFSIVQNSYAISCRQWDKYILNDLIKDIRIYSLTDFNSTHLAGDLLNEYFYARRTSDLVHYTIGEVIYELNNSEEMVQGVNFFLMSEPAFDTLFQFVVEIELAGNQILADTAKALNLY